MMAKDLIIIPAARPPAAPGQALARVGRFELPRAKNFIEKSLAADA